MKSAAKCLSTADFRLNDYYKRALDLVVSGRARQAFDIAREPDETRDL